MDALQRKNLTGQLSRISAAIAADLRQRMLEPGVVNERARLLHADEEVGDAFELWTDLLSRRAAVLWVLKSVYVRVLEDRGLLRPLRAVDRASQGLFERLAPSLGETAYLKWVYRDLASTEGGLPELFALQPAEIALPSNDLSKQLLELWRRRDQDTGELVFRFDQEHFDGRLMGDLYQDLDPVVKKRFALLQTPDFVVDFILDETLTPAIAEYGVETVRVLDPSCGSGHFLLAAFKRLVAQMRENHPDRAVRDVAVDVLARVVGIDLNDYACGLARARLVMTALELCGETELGTASGFHPQVFWADALEQVERDEPKQMGLPGTGMEDDKPPALMTRPEVRAALRPVLKGGFHVVVGNPPYITEKDASKKAYERQLIGRKRRYVSASGKYSLAAPFTERMLQIARADGFIGQITTNSFLRREFGKALIEDVLSAEELYKVVDSSGAHLPGHGYPTVILFLRRRPPNGGAVPVVMGKRAEPGKPDDPASGKVWSSIADGHSLIGYESEYISVSRVPRATLAKHPWSIGGGGAADLKEAIDCQPTTLGRLAVIGIGGMSNADDVFIGSERSWARLGVGVEWLRSLVTGDEPRDWMLDPRFRVFFPYDSELALRALDASSLAALWPFKTLLWSRAVFSGGSYRDSGRPWWEWHQVTIDRYRTKASIAYGEVATHNHFVLDRAGCAFNQSAPMIKLPAGASAEDHMMLLAQMNSSTCCFWLKQVCQNRAGSGINRGIQPEPWMDRYAFNGTRVDAFPLALAARHPGIERFAERLDELGCARVLDPVTGVINGRAMDGARPVRSGMDSWRQRDTDRLLMMVALQEELDWLCYNLYGIDPDVEIRSPDEVKPLTPGQRPFEVALAREDGERRGAIVRGEEPDEAPTAWFERHGWTPITDLEAIDDPEERAIVASRIERTAASKWLSLVEQPTYKRRWYRPNYEEQEQEALRTWLADRLEDWSKTRERPWTIKEAALALETDPAVLAVAELIAGRSTFDLTALITDRVRADSVPSCKMHVYTEEGLRKRAVWEETWEMQRREDAGEKITPAVPPKYAKEDFQRGEYWTLRGKLDVPKERFIALTEVPGRANGETPYGWAGWTHRQRAKVLLQLDEELENEGVALTERYAILYQVGFLIPYVEWESPKAAAEFRAVVTSLVGGEGVTQQMLRTWAETHAVTRARASTGRTARKKAAAGGDGAPSEPKARKPRARKGEKTS